MQKTNSKDKKIFLKHGLKQFKTHGALFPSSKYLCNKMLENVQMKEGVRIVELGAGTGAFTKQIIERLPKNGTLIILEINNSLVEYLKSIIDDSRVIIIEGDAKDLKKHLDKLAINSIDYVVSGLPLGNFSKPMRQGILDAIKISIGKNGVYIQFQYLLASYLHIKKMFDIKIVGYECRNVPPAFVYLCRDQTSPLG